jgi:oligoribonuclease NrnB/cAMP/cGMP phosphodiesterase (DHH superfamily)
MIPSNTLLMTHKACQDGSACALLFLAAGGKKENIHFCNPAHVETDAMLYELIHDTDDSDIWMVDLSISKEMADSIRDTVHECRIEIIDHHNSAIPLKEYYFCQIDENNSQCGSMLFYNWLFGLSGSGHGELRKYKELVTLTDDIDRWKHNYPESGQLAVLHKILGQELFIERFKKNPGVDLTDQEHYLIDINNKKREIDTKNRKKSLKIITKIINSVEYRFGIVYSYGDDQSLLGNAICSDPGLDVDVAVIVGGHSISFRSNEDCSLDLSEVTKLNGGGGHKHAAGCNLNGIFGEDFLELIMNKLKLE